MVTCLSPNGTTISKGTDLPERLVVATLDGVVTARRTDDGYEAIGSALPGLHISALCYEPVRGGLFASSYAGGIYVSDDLGDTFRKTAPALGEANVYTVAARAVGDAVTLFAGTEPAAIYKSTDYGETWTELPALRDVPNVDKWSFPAPPHEAHLKDFVFDPADPAVFYVSVEQGGLFKTTDGGASFSELESIVQDDDEVYKDVHRLVLHPTRRDTMYLTGGDGSSVSHDGGVSWTRMTGRHWTVGYPDGLVVNPLEPDLIFICGAEEHPGTWRTSHCAAAHIARSTDGGATFEVLTNGLPELVVGNFEALSLSAAPGACELLAGTTDGEIYVSRDRGESFVLALKGLGPVSKGGHYRNLVSAH